MFLRLFRETDPFQLMFALGIVPDCDTSTKGYWNLVHAILRDRFKDKQAAQDWGRSLTMESANKIYTISESHRERFKSAKIRLRGSRYKVPVLIDPQGQDPEEFVISIVGPLDGFEMDDPVDLNALIAANGLNAVASHGVHLNV
jgi:hypothetical protein